MMFARNKWQADHPNIFSKTFSFVEKEDGVEVHYKWTNHKYFTQNANGEQEANDVPAGTWNMFIDNETLQIIIK